ncbi:MAG: alpha/beta hydrolase [Ectothiorhodospiraceae bacterium]|nr:alpha/beta hydrolase [Ectothiorhodospiraceae bacterium]
MALALRIAGILAVLYVLVGAALYLFQSRLIHLPSVPGRELASTPERIGLAYQDVWLETEDGLAIHGWFVPATEARGTLLFFHGNAGNISHRLDSLRIFNELDLNVLIIDYRGYGQSEGSPSETGLYRDAEAALGYLRAEREVPAGEIVLFGRSLGASVAAHLAEQHEGLGGLILESAFTSVADMAAELYPIFPAQLLVRHRYDALESLQGVTSPVLVVHGPDDEIVPYAHGRRLYEAAPEPKWFLELRGGHNEGFLRTGEDYASGLDAFLSEALR